MKAHMTLDLEAEGKGGKVMIVVAHLCLCSQFAVTVDYLFYDYIVLNNILSQTMALQNNFSESQK